MKRIFCFGYQYRCFGRNQHCLAVLGINSRGGAGSLLAYSAVVGFTGSIISLLMSKFIAKQSVGAEVIDTPRTEEEAWLRTPSKPKRGTQPENARSRHLPLPGQCLCHGRIEKQLLIAVSTGLLDHMTRDEVEAVLAHEMAHVGNGDMVTLTLIQGVVNTFVVFLSRIIANLIARNNDGSQSQELIS